MILNFREYNATYLGILVIDILRAGDIRLNGLFVTSLGVHLNIFGIVPCDPSC